MITPEEYADLLEMMDHAFKFKINQVVQHMVVGYQVDAPTGIGHQTDADDLSTWSLSFSAHTRYLVCERRLQQCHGGVQKHYYCRQVLSDGRTDNNYLLLAEHELAASQPVQRKEFKTKQELKDWVDGKGR